MGYNYNDELAKQEGAGFLLREISLKERLSQEKQKAEAEVERLTELLKLLEANPETDRILELLGRKCF